MNTCPTNAVVLYSFVVFLIGYNGGQAGIARASTTSVGFQSTIWHHVISLRHGSQELYHSKFAQTPFLGMAHLQRSRYSVCQWVPRHQHLPLGGTVINLGTTIMSGSNPEDLVRSGCLVAFEPDSKGSGPVLGLVINKVGKKKNMFTIAPAAAVAAGNAATVAIALRHIVYVIPGGGAYTTDDLLAFYNEPSLDASLLGDVWQMLLDESVDPTSRRNDGVKDELALAGTTNPRAMAELLVGEENPNPRQCYGAFRLLQKEGALRFKRRRDGQYEARSREAVELMIRQQEAEETAEAKKQVLPNHLRAVLNAGGGYVKSPIVKEEFSEGQQEVLKGLELLAVQSVARGEAYSTKSPAEDLGRELLNSMGRQPSPSNAFHLCVQLGLMKHHENLFVREAGVRQEFPEEVVKEAKAMMEKPPPDPDASIRKDLSHLKVYAVDSEDTMEVDDGVSVERLPGNAGERIWVHIADVTRWVREGSAMHLEARRRRTTTYLPEGSIPMFPAEVAHKLLSLRPGRDCYALSMGITLGNSGQIVDVILTPSLIHVTYRLTYDDVEEMLLSGLAGSSEEWELGRLSELSMMRYRYRVANGSVDKYHKCLDCNVKVIHKAEAASDPLSLGMVTIYSTLYPFSTGGVHLIKHRLAEDVLVPWRLVTCTADIDQVTDNPSVPAGYDIKISPQDPTSKSVRLVTEMMVMVGEGMGRLGYQSDVPLAYRTQEPPEQEIDEAMLEGLPEKYCRAQAVFRYMSPAVTKMTPNRHWGLGLESYVQWSSPIRRFGDLVTHFQVKKWIRDEPTQDAADVMMEIMSGEGAIQSANSVMRQTERYWIAEYMSRLVGREMEGYVVSVRDNRNKGGKLTFNVLLIGLGLTLPVSDPGINVDLGDSVVAKESLSSSSIPSTLRSSTLLHALDSRTPILEKLLTRAAGKYSDPPSSS